MSLRSMEATIALPGNSEYCKVAINSLAGDNRTGSWMRCRLVSLERAVPGHQAFSLAK